MYSVSRAMRKALYRVCHRLNGAVVIGLALVALAQQPVPPKVTQIKAPDFLVDAMWHGCRSEGLRRFKAHMLGNGWRF